MLLARTAIARHGVDMRFAAAAVLAATLASSPGCAHHQLTNKEVAIGAVVMVMIGGLVYLGVSQCQKGASFCEDKPPSSIGRR
jgi:hypothetical protein